MTNNKRIINEIKRINRKKERSIENFVSAILNISLYAAITWFAIFLVGTAFYNADSLFYLKVDAFGENLMSKVPFIMLAVAIFTFGKLFVYESQKESLVRVLKKSKKRAVR